MIRKRGIVLALLLLVAALVVAGLLLVRSLLSPDKFTSLLREQAALVGLRMQLSAPASPALWPHLAVELRGLRLSRVGHDQPMLHANRVLLVVPWRSMLRGEAEIQNLRVSSPYVDVEQTQAWLAGLTGGSANEKPKLPSISAGVHVAEGTVVKGNRVLLKSLQLNTGTLKPDQPFRMEASALDEHGKPLQLHIQTTPMQLDAGVQLQQLDLMLATDDPPSLRLQGELDWQGGLKLSGQLAGALQLTDRVFDVQMKSVPAVPGESAASIQLIVSGPGTRLDMTMPPSDMLGWWQSLHDSSESSLALPPVRGEISAQQLQLGSLQIEGLKIRSLAPAVSSSTHPAAAASTSPDDE